MDLPLDDDVFGEVLVDRRSATGHRDLWVGTCLGCGRRVMRRLDSLRHARRRGSVSSCARCRHQLRRGIEARPISDQEKKFLLLWETHGTLYSTRDEERMTSDIRDRVGRALGGWTPCIQKFEVESDEEESIEPADCDEAYTLQQVGDVFGVSRSRIGAVEMQALRRLRHTARSNMLRRALESAATLSAGCSYEDALIAMIDCVVPYDEATERPAAPAPLLPRFATESELDAAIARARAAERQKSEPKPASPGRGRIYGWIEPPQDAVNPAYGILRGLGRR